VATAPNFKATKSTFKNGVGEVHLASWKDFVDYVHEALLSVPEYIWRGQSCESWPLTPSLEREFSKSNVAPSSELGETLRFEHLERFKLATRGRLNPRDLEERHSCGCGKGDDTSETEDAPLGPSREEREINNWWAIGQHHGLKTPLLDWTTSPYVAAFFVFWQAERKCRTRDEGRAVYGINRKFVEQKSDEMRETHSGPGRPPVIDFVEPLYKDNPRLVSQGGLFTRSPDGLDVRQWVEANYDKQTKEVVWLLKLVLPDSDHEYILRALNRMNINPGSLFPDLNGASEFVNLRLRIRSY
jgi:hypothetical protein